MCSSDLAKLVFIDVFASGREHTTLERVGALVVPAMIVGVTCGVNFGGVTTRMETRPCKC